MRYTGGDIHFHLTGVDSAFVYDRARQRAHEVPELIAALLSRTSAMATLEEHATTLLQRMRLPPTQRSGVLAHLRALAQAGLLVSESELRGWAEAGANPGSQPGPIGMAALITCSRPEQAATSLSSLLEHLARFGRRCEVVVIDDSRDEGSRNRHIRALSGLDSRGSELVYAGIEERRRFARALAAAGISERVIQIALFDPHGHGFTPGVSRNALLLHAAGQTCYAADDDTLAEVVGPAGAEAALDLSNRDPAEMWFYADRQAALADTEVANVDLLACHEVLLGKDPGTCLATLGETARLELDGMRPPFLRRLCAGGRVAVTAFGLVGDCGLDSNAAYLLQAGAALGRLVEGDAPYQVLRDSREVLRVAPRYTLTSGPAFSATAAAYDHRELLPPFFPVGRGEDSIFAAALRLSLSRGAIGHVPWAIHHVPGSRAGFAQADTWKEPVALTLTQAAVLVMGTLDLPSGAGEPAERLRALGAHLEQAARLPLAEFEDMLQVERLRRLSDVLSAREQLLSEHADASDAWASDMEQGIAAVREACTTDRLPVAEDLAARMPEDKAREAVRTHLGEYGILLQAWPDMVRAARTLRSEGHALARPMRELA